MRNIFLAIAVLMASVPLAAQAQERFPKWYLGVQGAMSFVDDSDVDGNASGVPFNMDADYDTGYGVGLALGYMPAGTGTFFDSMRFDLEYYYRKSDLDTVAGASASGDLSSKSAMLNAYYDINTGTRWTPYLGAGAGWSEVTLDSSELDYDDDDSVFAWNLMAGIGYAPETLPNTVWSIGYRYFSTQDPKFHSKDGTERIEQDYDVHNVEAGVRMMF